MLKYYFWFLFVPIFGIGASEKPNILMILSDDQGWTDYGFMGHEHIETPYLDKLASESVLFKRAYVPTALCRPSLMTLATGHYVSTHGVTGNNPQPGGHHKDIPDVKEALISKVDKFDTLPELLADEGYLSFQCGKWWEGSYQRGGFTHGMTKGYPHKGGRHGDVGLKIGREGNQPVADFIDMASKEEKPFFIWYAPFMPHTPHTPPERLEKKYLAKGLSSSMAKYYAMCEWFDESCGDVVDILEKRNLRKNTLIVYVCDNGWTQNPDKNGYMPKSKRSPFEAGTRNPIFFSWPEHYKAVERTELCTSLDIFPTILSAAGAKISSDLPGLNLDETFRKGGEIDRNHLFGETYAHDIQDINDPEKTLLYRWCIEGDWKLLLNYDGMADHGKPLDPSFEKGPQLFNLKNDPFESKNLAHKRPELVAKLAKKIEGWYPLKVRKAITVSK